MTDSDPEYVVEGNDRKGIDARKYLESHGMDGKLIQILYGEESPDDLPYDYQHEGECVQGIVLTEEGAVEDVVEEELEGREFRKIDDSTFSTMAAAEELTGIFLREDVEIVELDRPAVYV